MPRTLQPSARTAFLVLGMHRSGTSAITRLIALMGVALPRTLLGKDESNPTGHWEPERLVELNDRILEKALSSWDDCSPSPISRLTLAERRIYEREATRIIAEEFPHDGDIVIKDPRICRLSDFYIDILEKSGFDVVPIIVARAPDAVASSLSSRNGFRRSYSILLWLTHLLEAEYATRGRKRSLLSYDDLMLDWEAELGREAPSLGIAWPLEEKTVETIDNHLQSKFQNHRKSVEELDPSWERRMAQRAHAAFLRLREADDPSCIEELDEIRAEFHAQHVYRHVVEEMLRRQRSLEAAHTDIRIMRSSIDEIERLRAQDSARIDELSKSHGDLSDTNSSLLIQLDDARTRIVVMSEQSASQTFARDDALQRNENLRREVDALRSSTSWRLTRPIRMLRRWLAGSATRLARDVAPSEARSPSTAAGRPQGPAALSEKLSLGKLSFLILATPHVLFVASLIAQRLERHGFQCTIRTEYDATEADSHDMSFVICAQMFERLPSAYYAVQMEQSVSSRWFTEKYFGTLKNAEAVLDYSYKNLPFLIENGIDRSRLFYVPLDTADQAMPPSDAGRSGGGEPAGEDRTQYVLFYGDIHCERRRRFIDRLKHEFEVRVVHDLFGEEMLAEIRSAAVVVNIHYYDDALLETTRIYEVLTQGTPIVSETSSDADLYPELEGLVDFVADGDVEGMCDAVRRLLENTSERQSRRQAIEAYAARRSARFDYFFDRFLLSQGLLSFQAFSRLNGGQIPADGALPRLCLSLPETQERRRMFDSLELPGFAVVDGVKLSPGWRACGMSFKLMFEAALRNGVQRMIVCEDDVLISPDHETRMAKVLSYLDERPQAWDVYLGVLADIHPETEILEVVEHEGETLVHIDHPVSMVFNVYNRSMIEKLARWDDSMSDVQGNTIDRYMQSGPVSRAVVSLPFLVGHREDVVSTLWGTGTQYASMIARSERLLRAKVAAHRAKAGLGSAA